MTVVPRRVVLATFGTRGDVLPFCVLGRELRERGHDVRLVTASDYHKSVRDFGLEPVETGGGFKAMLSDPELEGLFGNYFSLRPGALRGLFMLRRRIEMQLVEIMLVTLNEVRAADLVVYNPFAFFAGTFATESGVPAVRVMCQPLLPTRQTSLSLFGGRALGQLGNRLSYEAFRLLSPMLARTVRQVRRRSGAGRRIGVLANPLTAELGHAHHLAAYSPALSPVPGDWSVSAVATGAWIARRAPGAALQDYLESFLAAGPPPVYVGFGSMLWGAARNTEVVLRALALWGGRAIVSTGPGGLRLPDWGALPPQIQATSHADHALLFPRVAAVVHHGGAGTTVAALRAGRPNVVLPLLGDQLYWGRRVAAVGAGEAPIPLSRVTPEELAARIARACTEARFAQAAAQMAAALAAEPGVTAAADFVEGLLARPRAA